MVEMKPGENRLLRRSNLWLAVLTMLMMVITSLPYLFGYMSAPPGMQFMGIVLGTPDTTQYFTWMRSFSLSQASLIGNRMTAEPTEPVFFNLLWWLLGQIELATSWGPATTYQVFQLVTVATFVPISYWFCGLFSHGLQQRWVAFLVLIFGAGLGWVLVVGKYLLGELYWPFGVYTVEPNSFLSLMAFPHFSNAATFIVVILALILFAFEQRRLRYAVAAGVVGLILGFVHGYDLLLIYAVLGAYALVIVLRDGRWREAVLYTTIVGMISCPGALYSVYITTMFPTWRDVLAQFVNAGAWTPSPPVLLILLGVPGIVALGTLLSLKPFVTSDDRELFIKVWFVVHCFIIYLPVNYQIHYLNGWQFPIAILASRGLFETIMPWLRKRILLASVQPQRLGFTLATLFIVVCVPTNLYLFAWRFYDLSRYTRPYYLYQDEVDALHWLNQNSAPDEVVLSAMDVGQYIPSQTHARAFLAHWAMTLDFYRKRAAATAFYDANWAEAERQHLLATYQVRYVLWGEAELATGTLDPGSLPYLTKVFSAPKAQLYWVNLELIHDGLED